MLKLCSMCNVNEATILVACYTCSADHVMCSKCYREHVARKGVINETKFKKKEFDPDSLSELI